MDHTTSVILLFLGSLVLVFAANMATYYFVWKGLLHPRVWLAVFYGTMAIPGIVSVLTFRFWLARLVAAVGAMAAIAVSIRLLIESRRGR